MPIKIKIPPFTPEEEKKPIQASVSLKISKTLGGNILINDHKYLDIVISPAENKILTMPKPYVEKDVFELQRDFMYDLFKGGVTNRMVPEGGMGFGIVETTYPKEAEVDTLQSLLFRISEYFQHLDESSRTGEEYDKFIEDRFVDPNEEDSTRYGEIPQYEDTPAGRENHADSTYTFAGYGYYY